MKYPTITVMTHTAIALMRNSLNADELEQARIADIAEPMSHKAWRRILQGHSNIRGQIMDIRIARYGMGKKLSIRGMRQIESMKAMGHKWFDPKPCETEITALKHLANCLAEMPASWDALRRAEGKIVYARRLYSSEGEAAA